MQLEDYPQEFSKVFWPSFKFLATVNLNFWFNNERWLTKYWRFLYIAPISIVFAVMFTVDVSQVIKEGDFSEIANSISPFLIYIQGFIKFLLLFPKSTQITDIIKEMAALWITTGLNNKQLKDRHTLWKRVNFCNTAIYWIAIIDTIHYLMSPLYKILFYKIFLQKDLELTLPIVSRSYPFDPTRNWVVYFTTYMFQMYCSFISVCAYVGVELIMITLCALLSMEFSILCEDMRSVRPASQKTFCENMPSVRTTSKETLRGDMSVRPASMKTNRSYSTDDGAISIADFVKKHQKLISLSTRMDNAFNKIIFIDLMFAAATTCFFRYSAQFSSGLAVVNSCVGMLTVLFYVLHLCYYGEILTGASLSVGEAVYKSQWYKEDKHYQRTICMIIKRSQTPCGFTSMKYAPVTLNMFTKVISTTLSYISLMNSVYGDD